VTTRLKRLLLRLDQLKGQFGSGAERRIEDLLRRLAREKILDVEALIQFHEILLFVSAYPQSAPARQRAESQLRTFPQRIAFLRDNEVELTAFDNPEVSGVAGTTVVDTFSYYIVRWLFETHPREISVDWDWFNDENRLAETWPRFMPLLEEDALVEANVPYDQWLRAARGTSPSVAWLMKRFDSLHKREKETAELYDSQNIFVSWKPRFSASRTGLRSAIKKSAIFYHREPLIQRRDVSLVAELNKPRPRFERLTRKRGQRVLDLMREASAARYRELYGFTHGDAGRVLRVDIGRGIDVFVCGLPPETRLPLRAYHAAMMFKNGVPVGYFEGLSLFERMESGFNLYYTFRDGETAWLYARVLHIFRHLLGVTVFTLDPYQIGHENEEGIESGAFWFYRKLGFRSASREIMKSVSQEEGKIKTRSGYRTSARRLREFAEQQMIFDLNGARTSDWDRFQLRKIGFAAQKQMAKRYDGDARNFRAAAVRRLTRILGIRAEDGTVVRNSPLDDYAVALYSTSDLNDWSADEKQLLIRVIRAKSEADEGRYLRAMQRHIRLRRVLIALGT